MSDNKSSKHTKQWRRPPLSNQQQQVISVVDSNINNNQELSCNRLPNVLEPQKSDHSLESFLGTHKTTTNIHLSTTTTTRRNCHKMLHTYYYLPLYTLLVFIISIHTSSHYWHARPDHDQTPYMFGALASNINLPLHQNAAIKNNTIDVVRSASTSDSNHNNEHSSSSFFHNDPASNKLVSNHKIAQIATSSTASHPLQSRNFVKLTSNNITSVRTINYSHQLRHQHNNGNENYNRYSGYHNNSTGDLAAAASSVLTNSLRQNGDNTNTVKRIDLTFEKTCIGTSNRLSGQHNKTDHYQNLVERYRNCTYVIGNLEITWLDKGPDNKPLDMSFLDSIREITGYLLIAYVKLDSITLPNLQIIRGRDLFKLNTADGEFAVFALENSIRNLEMPNLREILAGSVGFYWNKNLCHVNTITWEEILNSPIYGTLYRYNESMPQDCPPCHSSCPNNCWSPSEDMCQRFSKIYCSPQCSQGRCFGQGPRDCCHLFCAGGCTGPKQSDCLACKHFYDDGACVQECPSMQRYNPNTFSWELNPDGKYAHGSWCVKECPEHLLRDNNACVRTCPPNKKSQDGECVPCGDGCTKRCLGVDVVHSGNIDNFVNCTEIEGSLTILDTSFTGYAEVYSNNTIGTRYAPMPPSRLEVFKSLREITGYLSIQASHPEFKNLSYFRNLKTIGGRQTADMFQALLIIKTSLVSLNLRSLKKIRSGRMTIEENADLCFANTIDWSRLNITKGEDIIIRNNAGKDKCRAMNLKCHEQCSPEGCWGPGPDECLSCKSHKLDDYCVRGCSSTYQVGLLSYDAGNKTCKKCHPECKGGCSGDDVQHCWECKNVKDGPYCVEKCPIHKYNNNGVCLECSENCVDGCTGPSGRLGEGGCNSCGKAVINSTSPFVAHCIKASETCPEGYYQEYVGPQVDGPLKSSFGRPVCRKCHHRCKSCTGMGTHTSVCTCAKFAAGEQCEDYCPRDYYADEKSRQCLKCSPVCNGCFGPTEADCISCRVYRIYSGSNGPVAAAHIIDKTPIAIDTNEPQVRSTNDRFNCTDQCPPDKPHRISDSNMRDPYCSEYPGLDSDNSMSFFWACLVFIPIMVVAVMCCLSLYKCQIEKDQKLKLTMQLSGFDDVEPLNQSNLKPNLAALRSIKETELRKGNILGSGFGGTVYQGLWYPEGQENKKPRPVAIKVLRDNDQTNMNKEFLDEAYIMASVKHPNLVSLLAVCMTSTQLMLVTQLMPLGCLLDYVKKHQNDIGSKNLLEWGKQIARGMAYLEDRRMVHRDLALRNVLLQTSGRALISDFGLAKFLEVDQSAYQSGGGRLPIKWLAPECIRERKFTHKSDVWAFGVTLWELLTFGQRPFEEYDTKDVPMEIEKGARLQQPRHVSAEVYKVMYACWFYNPSDRPNFQTLWQNMINFARDPERYLDPERCKAKGIDYGMRRDFGRSNSDSDDNFAEEYVPDDENSLSDEEVQPMSAMPDLLASLHGRSNDMFFELRHHHSESETHNGALSTPTFKTGIFSETNGHSSGDVFSKALNGNTSTITKMVNNTLDKNNNNTAVTIGDMGNTRANNNADSCGSVPHTVSTMSLGQKSEQPTDNDDYLLPSPAVPATNEEKFSRFLATHNPSQNARISPPTNSPRDPPHSAGLIGYSYNNDEYFLTRTNYVNSNGSQTNASIGNIPHSLV